MRWNGPGAGLAMRQTGKGTMDTGRLVDDSGLGSHGKAIKWALALIILFVALSFAYPLLGFYTDWQWFMHDARHPEVFAKTWNTRALLWGAGFIVSILFVALNVRRMTDVVAVYGDRPSGPQEAAAAGILSAAQRFGRVLGFVVSLLVALGVAGSFSRSYQDLWMFQASTSFGIKDPVFGRDLSFYVFQLPWLERLVGAATELLVVTLALALLAKFGLGSLARAANAVVEGRSSRVQISLLASFLLIALGVRGLLARYGMLTSPGTQFTGPGFAQSQAIAIAGVLAWVAVAVGALSIANAWYGRPFRAVIAGAAGLAAAAVLGLGVYPSAVQALRVEPDKIRVERPFASRAIKMTRYAYGLDKFEVRNFDVQPAPTPAEVEAADTTLQNMRLWDPVVLQTVLDNLQTLKPYYDFTDVDIDRYDVGGKRQMVMVAPRNIKLAGIVPSSRSWVTEKLVYTHGFGVSMAPVNEASGTGRPNLLVKDMPPASAPGAPKVTEPRIYFSDYPAGSDERESYLLLGTNQAEFDYPAETEHMTAWTGTRGVPVGGPLARMAYSMHFSDGNLMISGNIKAGTRILYRRDVTDRARLVYPMLRFDTDPYVVVAGGRLVWMLDGYTTTNRIPYSEAVAGPQGHLNYIRNSVKVTVDAYTGDMTAYAYDEQEPVLRAIRKVFPKLIRPRSEMPAELVQHVRYGEDGFQYQSQALTQYHVTEPDTFMKNQDAWEIPAERGRKGEGEPILPYYVQARLPGEARDAFMLILPFTPRAKNNMIGWMGANCDPDGYGHVVLYKFPADTQTQGPSQMESTFNADPVVADINRQLNNDQSEIIPGNLLVIPIGSSILYVKPLFLQNRSARVAQIPELKKVLLGLQNKVVVGDTYQEALNKLFGGQQTVKAVAPEAAAPTAPTGGTVNVSQVRDALKLLDQAEAAQRQGDWAKYGNLLQQARDRLRELAR